MFNSHDAAQLKKCSELFNRIMAELSGLSVAYSIDVLILRASALYEGYILLFLDAGHRTDNTILHFQNLIKDVSSYFQKHAEMLHHRLPLSDYDVSEVIHQLTVIKSSLCKNNSFEQSISAVICCEAARLFIQNDIVGVRTVIHFLQHFHVPSALLPLILSLHSCVALMLDESTTLPKLQYGMRKEQGQVIDVETYLELHEMYLQGSHLELLESISQAVRDIDQKNILVKASLYNILGSCLLKNGEATKAVAALQSSCELLENNTLGLIPLLNLAHACSKFHYKEGDEITLLTSIDQRMMSAARPSDILGAFQYCYFINVTQKQVTREIKILSLVQVKYLLARRCLDHEFLAEASTIYIQLYDMMRDENSMLIFDTGVGYVKLPPMFTIVHEMADCLLRCGKYRKCVEVCNHGIGQYHSKCHQTTSPVRCACEECVNSSPFHIPLQARSSSKKRVKTLCEFTSVADALQHLPHDVTCLTIKGKALAYLGWFSEARQCFQKVIDCLTVILPHYSPDPERSTSSNQMGRSASIDASNSECKSPACRYLMSVKADCLYSMSLLHYCDGNGCSNSSVTTAHNLIRLSLMHQPGITVVHLSHSIMLIKQAGQLLMGARQWLEHRDVLPKISLDTPVVVIDLKQKLAAKEDTVKSLQDMLDIKEAVAGDSSVQGVDEDMMKLHFAHMDCVCLRIVIDKTLALA